MTELSPGARRFTRTLSGAMIAVAVGLLCNRPGGADEPEKPQLPDGMQLTSPSIPESVTGTLRSINERLSDGVRPEENAAVWLAHIYGADAFEPELRAATLQMLGIEKMSPASPLFVSLDDFVKSLPDVSSEEEKLQAGVLQEQLFESGTLLWTKGQNPRLAAYLAANTKALDVLTIAAARPRYYAPLLTVETPPRLLSASLVIERRLPFLARMLAARAVLRFNQQDFPGCSSDLMACHKLAFLLAEGSPFDVSVAKAQVIDAFAYFAEVTLLDGAGMTARQLADFREALQKVPPLPPSADAARIGERAILHQELELLQTDAESVAGFFETGEHQQQKAPVTQNLAKVDWKLALEGANAVQNQIIQALKTTDRRKQDQLFAKLDQQHAAWEKTVDDKTDHFSREILKDPQGMSRWVGENLAMSLRPLYRQRRNTDDRARARRLLILYGCEIEQYQRENGTFPAKLDDAILRYEREVALDPCTDKPLEYTRSSPDTATLMSLGNNQQNDAGEFYNDDFEVRLQ